MPAPPSPFAPKPRRHRAKLLLPVAGLGLLTTSSIPADVPYRWMTYVEGECHAELSCYAVEHGGHVRTGIGDNPSFEGAALTNAEQVARIVEMAGAAGRQVCNPSETRRLLATTPEVTT